MAPTSGLLDASRVSVFFDGTLSDPQLDHPEGLAVHRDRSVWCGGERGQVFRVDPEGRVEVLFREWSAHLLAHPTNLAFRGTTMFTANLGRWHLTRLEVGAEGLALATGGRR
jgi:hypothetical protein